MLTQIETGTPYMLYKDSCNLKSNQQNLGTIRSSNLCTEIVEYTSPDEIAVCNLASVVLPRCVRGAGFGPGAGQGYGPEVREEAGEGKGEGLGEGLGEGREESGERASQYLAEAAKVLVGEYTTTTSTTPSVFQCLPMTPDYSSPFQHPLFVSPDVSQCLPSTPNDSNYV